MAQSHGGANIKGRVSTKGGRLHEHLISLRKPHLLISAGLDPEMGGGGGGGVIG